MACIHGVDMFKHVLDYVVGYQAGQTCVLDYFVGHGMRDVPGIGVRNAFEM